MNFPDNQRTGALAELSVEHLFTSWGWVVGKDHIDAGYDLCVEPDQARYKGARFLVQVKGTARNKGKAIVASVGKKRLRQYAENPLPVILVRSSADGTLYWLHAQHWTRANMHKLKDDGDSGVRFDKTQRMSDREAFEDFLDRVLSPPSQRTGALRELAEERSRYLSSLDQRLRVRTSVIDGVERHEISAAPDEVNSTFQFQASSSHENINNLRDAIEFGIPNSIEVEAFRMEGSPVFDAIGASSKLRGTLTIQSTLRHVGTVYLYPGAKRSMLAPELAIAAALFSGHKGVAISNQSFESLFDLSVRLTPENGSGKASVSVGFRPGAISSQPIQYLKDLASISDWAEKVMDQGVMHVELAFKEVRAPLSVPEGLMESMRPFLSFANILGKLHLIAKTLNSDFTVLDDFAFKREDISDIDLAFGLLKGERRAIGIGPMEFEPASGSDFAQQQGEFYITTTMSFAICGRTLGDIPVGIELPGFGIEKIPDSSKYRLLKGNEGQAWISYSEHDVINGKVRRVPAN